MGYGIGKQVEEKQLIRVLIVGQRSAENGDSYTLETNLSINIHASEPKLFV